MRTKVFRRNVACIATLVGLVIGAPHVSAQDHHARAASQRHLDRGLKLFAERDFEAAIRAFHAGYAALPRREFLFALGQAERLSGDCASAIVYYERFLSRNPPPVQAAAATHHRERCRAALGSGPGIERRRLAAAQRQSRGADKRAVAQPVPRRRSAWYRDPINVGLATGAAVGLLLSSSYWSASGRAQADANAATSYAAHREASARAYRNRNLSLGFLAVACGLGTGMAYRIASRRGAERRGIALSLSPARDGAAAWLRGSF